MHMDKTAANFRAMRELCGLTKQDIAALFEVSPQSVKRWDRSEAPIPDAIFEEVLDIYADICADAEEYANEAMRQVEQAKRDSRGEIAPNVAIRYYRTQAELDAEDPDIVLPVNVINAVARRAYEILINAGYDACFAYSADASNL